MLSDRRKRRLDRIAQDASGRYVYTGELFAYAGETPRGKALGCLAAVCALSFLALLGAGLMPAPGMTGAWYCVLPYSLCLVSEISAVWSLGQVLLGGDPMRELPHEAATIHLPRRLLLTAVLGGLGVLGEAVYLLLHGAGGKGGPAVAFLVLTALSAAMAMLGRRLSKGLIWEQRPNENL